MCRDNITHELVYLIKRFVIETQTGGINPYFADLSHNTTMFKALSD